MKWIKVTYIFLWLRSVERQDFTIVGYKNSRLSFGLWYCPTILMLTLFKLLVVDARQDPSDIKHLKSLIYHLSYMDNCALTYDNADELNWAFDLLNPIFNPYRFELQQLLQIANSCRIRLIPVMVLLQVMMLIYRELLGIALMTTSILNLLLLKFMLRLKDNYYLQ